EPVPGEIDVTVRLAERSGVHDAETTLMVRGVEPGTMGVLEFTVSEPLPAAAVKVTLLPLPPPDVPPVESEPEKLQLLNSGSPIENEKDNTSPETKLSLANAEAAVALRFHWPALTAVQPVEAAA